MGMRGRACRIGGVMMNKLFLLAVLVPLLFAVPLAFATSESIAASDSVGTSPGAAGSESAVSSSSASVQASSESKGGASAVATTGAEMAISSSSETKGGEPSSVSSEPAPTQAPPKNEVAPTPGTTPNPVSYPPVKAPSPSIKPATASATTYSVIVVPSVANLGVGQSQQFQAYLVINGSVPNDVDFIWTTTGGVGSIDSSGLFTATAAGNGAVTATHSSPNGIVSGSAHVTVTGGSPPGNNSSTVAYLLVLPTNAPLNIGGTQQFNAYLVVNGSVPSDVPVSWSTTGGVGSIDINGLFTATSAGAGTVVAAYSGANFTLTGSASVLVNSSPPPPPGNFTYTLLISPTSANLMVGATQHFIAQLYDENGTYMLDVDDADLSWSSSNATVGAIDSLGIFTALSAGSALVNVVYIGDIYPNVSSQNTANVTVAAAPLPANVSYITVTPQTVALFTGQSQQFIATAYDSGNSSLGVLPNSNLSWSVTSGIGAIDANGTFSASSVGSGTVTAVYVRPSPLIAISGNASVTVSQFVPSPIGGGGSGGSGGSNSNGGASFKTSTTVSFSCAGKTGTVKITVYDSAVKNATVEIIYAGGSKSEKVLVKEITGTTSLDFTPSQAGDYILRVTVGTDQTNANFFVPHCGPQTLNVTQNITVRLEPSRELVFTKLVNYPGGFSKRFSVYKITDGQTESFESDIVLYLNYTGNSTRYDFDILDSVPSSVLARSSQITFSDRPSILSSEPRFEWHVKSVSKGGRLSYAYSFGRPLTEQMIDLFGAPTIREAATGSPSAKPAQDAGLLSASIGPMFGITVPLLGVVFAFLVLLALLYFFLFGKKKEEV